MPSSSSVGRISRSGSRYQSDVLALDRGDRLDGVRPPDSVCGGFRQAEVLHLALLNQAIDGAGDVFDRHIRVDAMLVVQVDRLDLQSREGALDHACDVFRPAVEATPPSLALCARRPPEFGRDHDLTTERRQGFADERFIRVRTVDLRGVEERHATIDGGAEQGQHGVPVRNRAVGPAHAHAAKPHRRHVQAAPPKCALLHRCCLIRHPLVSTVPTPPANVRRDWTG